MIQGWNENGTVTRILDAVLATGHEDNAAAPRKPNLNTSKSTVSIGDMDLKDFISVTLTSIVQGVEDAQTKSEASRATIMPNLVSAGTLTNPNKQIQTVEFDVAVTVTDESQSGAKIGVLAGFLGGGVQGSSANMSGSVTRIKFAVPVALPIDHRPIIR